MKKLINPHWFKIKKSLKAKRAFTLIEMLVVLVVVALLMAIIIPNVAGQRDRINEQATVNIAEIITTQAETYKIVNGTDADLTLTILSEEGYITDRQLTEAENLLNLEADDSLPNPIPLPGSEP